MQKDVLLSTEFEIFSSVLQTVFLRSINVILAVEEMQF